MATGELIDVDPEAALAHATVARRLASRIPAVREAVGLAAYHAGDWRTAIGELRAYHRMSGRLSHLAVLADCERALGRPERAIDIFRTADRRLLTDEEAAELLIVAAGARADLGQREAAAAMLQVPQLSGDQPWVARLRYAYADALLALGRAAEAREWFSRAVDLDPEGTTDAAERLLELEGVVLDEAEEPEDDETDGDETDETDGDETDGEQTDRGQPEAGGASAGSGTGGSATQRSGDDGPAGAEDPRDAARPVDGQAPGSGDADAGAAGDRGYSGDGANPGTAVGGAGPANTLSDVEGAVAYDDDDLEDFDDDDDLDDEDLADFDDDLDDEDIDDNDDLEDDDFDDDEFDEEDDDFDDDDLEDDDLDDDEFDDDDFGDDEDDEDGGRNPR